MTEVSDRNSAELERAFERATRVAGKHERFVSIGGRQVALAFAGLELGQRVMPAFAHVEQRRGGRAELTISVAESETTRVALQLEPPGTGDPSPAAGRTSDGPRPMYVADSDTTHFFDRGQQRAFLWLRSPSVLRPWDLAGPFRILLSWWAQSLGAQLAHGAVVGRKTAGILLAGPGGAGKSTLTLACLQRGLCTAGDDYVWVDSRGSPKASSLYCTVKVDRDALKTHFSALASAAREIEGEKATLYLAGETLATEMPLRAVAVLRVHAGVKPRVRPASPIEVLAALAPSSLLPLPGSGPNALRRLSQLVRATRALVFEAGSDYVANADAITRLLDDAGRRGEQLAAEGAR